MSENDEKAKSAIPEGIESIGIKPYFPKALPLWHYCMPRPSDEGVFALFLIFWALSVPILAEGDGDDAVSIWLGGALLIFSIRALSWLANGYVEWVRAVELEERQKGYREP